MIEKRVEDLLQRICTDCKRILGQDLVGIYVHGSLALGCFSWDVSDVDFLIVTKGVPELNKKTELMEAILAIDAVSPPKGLEMSLVTLQACRNFVYPTPFELHFSHGHLERAQKDPEKFAEEMHGTDPDLAAHFTITRHAGFALTGPAIGEVFAPVPREDYLSSIRLDVEHAEDEIGEAPVYLSLNLCRVLAYAQDGLILSKAQGGQWGMEHLEAEEADIVRAAYEAYTQGKAFDASQYGDELKSFARRMCKRIFEA